jgi:hypothetical protein
MSKRKAQHWPIDVSQRHHDHISVTIAKSETRQKKRALLVVTGHLYVVALIDGHRISVLDARSHRSRSRYARPSESITLVDSIHSAPHHITSHYITRGSKERGDGVQFDKADKTIQAQNACSVRSDSSIAPCRATELRAAIWPRFKK